ncbi:MAG: HMA2 domain-containing protein [Gloeotrichia echinulata IR180]|jgi:hypothetical protein
MPSKVISTKVISDTPGRLRLRVSQPYRQAKEMQRIAHTLEAQPNISQVRTNIHHGSILINHDGKDDSLENVLAALEDMGIIVADITEKNPDASTGVTNAVVDLNKRIEQATNGAVDLRFLFPMGLGILAVRQLLVKGVQLEVIPWYVLAWYAFDSFIKLNDTSQPKNLSH